MAWKLRIYLEDGSSFLDEEEYDSEDEAIDAKSEWFEGWSQGMEDLELNGGEDYNSHVIEDIEIYEE